MAANWQPMRMLPDFVECPDSIIVWNDCNGPMELNVEPGDVEKLRADSGWYLWRDVPRPTEAEIAAALADDNLLRAHWENFTECQAVPDGFPECLEASGLVEFRRVTRDDLEQSGAEDRGIVKGGMCWSLTAAGEDVLSNPHPYNPNR